jgi:lysozyme family protein
MSDDFARALTILLSVEGGYSNDPDDAGGATNHGITQRIYHAWRDTQRLPRQSVKEITDAEVADIYEEWYWVPSRAGELPWPLAGIHFDCFANCRPEAARKQLQRALGVVDDGVFGPRTLQAAQAAGRLECYRYLLERVWHYRKLARQVPRQVKFLSGGWLGRLERWAKEVV